MEMAETLTVTKELARGSLDMEVLVTNVFGMDTQQHCMPTMKQDR